MATGTFENGDYTEEDDSSGDYRILDPQGNVIFRWDESNGEWNLENNPLTNVSSVSTGSVLVGDNDTISGIETGSYSHSDPGTASDGTVDTEAADSVTVNFNTAFDSAPTVVPQWDGSDYNGAHITIDSVTATSFTSVFHNLRSNFSSGADVSYVAVETQ